MPHALPGCTSWQMPVCTSSPWLCMQPKTRGGLGGLHHTSAEVCALSLSFSADFHSGFWGA